LLKADPAGATLNTLLATLKSVRDYLLVWISVTRVRRRCCLEMFEDFYSFFGSRRRSGTNAGSQTDFWTTFPKLNSPISFPTDISPDLTSFLI